MARDECGAARTEFACAGEWPDPKWGGEHVLHPLHPEANAHIEKLQGYRLSQFRARAHPVPTLPAYLPQVPFRTALKGYLDQDWYALRAKAVFRRGGIKSADEMRKRLGLAETQKIAILLFDKDPLLERIYNDPRLVKELAQGNFDLVTAASFSIWEPRPRLHQLHNLMRSLELFVTLQQEGAVAIPRLDWVISHDVYRSINWLSENPCIEMISIDAMTSRNAGWPQLLQALEEFDSGTNRRLRYLINGPSTATKWSEVHGLLGPGRYSITEAGPARWNPTEQEKSLFPGPHQSVFGPRTQGRLHRRQSEFQEAIAA